MGDSMEDHTAFYRFLGEYADFMEEMEAVQKEKLDALLSKDLQRIERSIKSQQAYAMRLDNIERRRIRQQEESGLSGKPISVILEEAPQESKNELRLIYGRLQTAVSNIKYLNGKASEVAESNIRRIGSSIPKSTHGYENDPAGKRDGNLMDTKI